MIKKFKSNQNILLEKVMLANEKFLHIKKHSQILVGFSGGADSCSLLLALNSLKSELEIELNAVHINHMIRGEEADRDEFFANSFCERLNIRFFVKHINIPELCKITKNSLELEARNARYTAFSEICESEGFDYIATAHNANDFCETMILNLTRGATLRGLCSIPPKRGNIIRPLILCERKEIEDYLSEIGETYVTDSTNFDTIYTRNLIRHDILPKLKKINPSLESTLFKSVDCLKLDLEYFESIVAKENTDDISKLCTLHQSILSRIILNSLQAKFQQIPIENKHIENIMKMVYSSEGKNNFYSEISLPNKTIAKISQGKLIFLKLSEQNISTDFFQVLINGENEIKNTNFVFFVVENELCTNLDERIYKLLNKIVLISDRISGKLFVRNRLAGDSYKTLGFTKSLKKLFNDKKIPLEKRAKIPILCDDDSIIFVPYFSVSDRFSKSNEDFSSKNNKTIIYIYEKI